MCINISVYFRLLFWLSTRYVLQSLLEEFMVVLNVFVDFQSPHRLDRVLRTFSLMVVLPTEIGMQIAEFIRWWWWRSFLLRTLQLPAFQKEPKSTLGHSQRKNS